MYCRNCGKDNPETAQVCDGCGAALELADAQPAQTQQTGALKTSPLAIWSLVCSLAGCLCLLPGIPGLILGIMGLKQVKERPQEYTGSGLAIAGIVVSIVSILGLSIAILSAILFPTFNASRHKARKYSCLNNMKQLNVSMKMYQSDWDEVYPLAGAWCDSIMPYVKSEERYRCPTKPELRCGYAVSANIAGQPESAITSVAETVSMFESDKGWNAFGVSDAMIQEPRHQQFCVGYADGHASFVTENGASRLKWTR